MSGTLQVTLSKMSLFHLSNFNLQLPLAGSRAKMEFSVLKHSFFTLFISLGKNDAYAMIKLGGQKFKTEVKKDAGKECHWGQTFHL